MKLWSGAFDQQHTLNNFEETEKCLRVKKKKNLNKKTSFIQFSPRVVERWLRLDGRTDEVATILSPFGEHKIVFSGW